MMTFFIFSQFVQSGDDFTLNRRRKQEPWPSTGRCLIFDKFVTFCNSQEEETRALVKSNGGLEPLVALIKVNPHSVHHHHHHHHHHHNNDYDDDNQTGV